MKKRFASYLLLATALVAQATLSPQKTACRLSRYQPQAPALAHLNLAEAEKKDIIRLVQEGRRIDAVLVLRKCGDLTLKEQKMLVDSLQQRP